MGRGGGAAVEPRIVAIAGQKGGTGKSTIAVHLASEWRRRGKRVLLVDADPQGSALTWGEVAAEQMREGTPMCVAMGENLRQQLPQAISGFDVILIDCPGAKESERQLAALAVADFVLLPCGPTTMEVWALAESVRLVQQVQELRPELRCAIVINKEDSRTGETKVARDSMETLGLPIFKATLGMRTSYSKAVAAGQGITTFEPRGEAAAELVGVLDELIGELEVNHG